MAKDGWYPVSEWCYGDEKMLTTIRKEIVDRIEGDTKFTAFGISDMTPLCPLIAWELHRKNPNYSNWPHPKTCDYGYHVTAEQHFSNEFRAGALKWVLKLDRDGSSSESSISSLLKEAGADTWRQYPITMPHRGYSGTLYQVPNS